MIHHAQHLQIKGTFDSHEKVPFLMDIAGNPGVNGGFGSMTLSSASNSSSKRVKDTFALTT